MIDIAITTNELFDEITNGNKPIFYDAQKLALSVELANSSIKPKFVKQEYKIFIEDNGSNIPDVCVGGTTLRIPSVSLARHFYNCDSAIFFCATLGHEADNQIERAKSNDVELAVLLDTAYLLLIEKLCDQINTDIKSHYTSFETTTRYSLGYDDSPLSLQGEFLQILNAEKKLGVLVTEGGMMLPSKSVTAMIGLKEKIGFTNLSC